MFEVTCLTCRQVRKIEKLPDPLIIGLTYGVIIKMPCGHGQFVGTAPMVIAEVLTDYQLYRWEWMDQVYLTALSTLHQYDETTPYPTRPLWDPPPLSITCACGTQIELKGSTGLEGVGDGNGWEGGCPTCGLTFTVADLKNRHPYSQGLWTPFEKAVRRWQRHRPTVPERKSVEVTEFLREVC